MVHWNKIDVTDNCNLFSNLRSTEMPTLPKTYRKTRMCMKEDEIFQLSRRIFQTFGSTCIGTNLFFLQNLIVPTSNLNGKNNTFWNGFKNILSVQGNIYSTFCQNCFILQRIKVYWILLLYSRILFKRPYELLHVCASRQSNSFEECVLRRFQASITFPGCP